MEGAIEPVGDEEIVYRRIPTKPEYFDPIVSPTPTPLAFRPREQDTTGLSVYRANYVSPQQVATNSRGAKFFVASLRVCDLRANGIDVVARPKPDEPGHAEISSLTYLERNTDSAREMQQLLAEKLWFKIEGPYP